MKYEDEILDFWSFGFNDKEISDEIDCSSVHVLNARHKYNLPKNRGVKNLINFFKGLDDGPKFPGELENPRIKYISARDLGYDVCRMTLKGKSVYFIRGDRNKAVDKLMIETGASGRDMNIPNFSVPFQRSVREFILFWGENSG